MRTASAYAQFGVTLAQLFRLNVDSANAITPTALKIAKGLGATVEVIAIVFSLLGAAYFLKQQAGLMKGVTMGRGYEVWIMSFMSFAVSVCFDRMRRFRAHGLLAVCYYPGAAGYC